MNKRQFIKSSLATLTTSALTLTQAGCDKNNKTAQNQILNTDDIIPKQTGIYEFSCPLPFNYKTIDEIVELNSTLKKSQITSFYNNTPNPLASKFNQWIQIARGGPNLLIKTYNDFFKYVDYAQQNGFKFTYLMNSPKPFSEKDFKTFKDDFLYLLDLLKKHNVKNIKVANTQVIDLINNYAPNEFDYSASTVFEYHTLAQYEHLFETYPNFKLLDLTYDENQNFKLIRNLKNRFPNIKIELMINDPCIKGCPSRIAHESELDFYHYKCSLIRQKIGKLAFILACSTIYPWDIEYYSALGINNFKYVAYSPGGNKIPNNRADYKDILSLKTYLDFIENNNLDIPAFEFLFNAGFGFSKFIDKETGKQTNPIKLSQVKDFFPDIKYFIKHGAECHYKCGVECKYCFECAKKLESLFMNV